MCGVPDVAATGGSDCSEDGRSASVWRFDPLEEFQLLNEDVYIDDATKIIVFDFSLDFSVARCVARIDLIEKHQLP